MSPIVKVSAVAWPACPPLLVLLALKPLLSVSLAQYGLMTKTLASLSELSRELTKERHTSPTNHAHKLDVNSTKNSFLPPPNVTSETTTYNDNRPAAPPREHSPDQPTATADEGEEVRTLLVTGSLSWYWIYFFSILPCRRFYMFSCFATLQPDSTSTGWATKFDVISWPPCLSLSDSEDVLGLRDFLRPEDCGAMNGKGADRVDHHGG